ncbi:MAG: hypothetical protein PHR53_07620 [Bacteroidales bacterium]|nr:hypothetical protein [Bacteroidales bacterium]
MLLYCPCIATVIACRKESSAKWSVFLIVYTTLIAWIISFGIYQIGILF